MSISSPDLAYQLALDRNTQAALSNFSRRRRWLVILRTIAAGVVFFVASMVFIAIVDYLWLISDGLRWTLSVIGYGVTAGAMYWFGLRHLGTGDPREVARQLEAAEPELREDLLSAVELADPNEANGSKGFRGWLQSRVGKQAGSLNVNALLPMGLIQRWLTAGVVILATCVCLMLIPKMQFGRRIARAMLPIVPIERASMTKIEILKPSPPTGFVAQGDAVGVVIQLSGRPVREVKMQWRTDEGLEGETPMTARVEAVAQKVEGADASQETSDGGSQGGTLATNQKYAANLSVGNSPMHYRVIAGDAITLWHELTPLPRPRAESFTKRYEFPTYAKLSERVEEAEHGDLKALIGTLAHVTIRFDEAVSEASLRFGNRGTSIELTPVDGSDREFTATIGVKTAGSYQVDAVSLRSGLNNPFSPQYTINPVIDSPPVVRWEDSIKRTMIVSPLDVVHLTANAVDDLPMERVVQEFQVNGEEISRREIDVLEAGRELKLEWDWDLMRRGDGTKELPKLRGGDIVRSRLIAIDRRAQQGESGVIEFLIAEEGFDTDRHERLEELRDLIKQVSDWSLKAKELMADLEDIKKHQGNQLYQEGLEKAEAIHDEKTSVYQRLEDVLGASRNLPEAGALELCGRALLDIDRKIGAWIDRTGELLNNEHDTKKDRDRDLGSFGNHAKRISSHAGRLEQYARAIFGEAFTVGVVADATALERSLAPMLNQESPLPIDRFPRYVMVALGRMKAIEEMIEANEETLPDSTSRHLQNWHRWVDTWSGRLQTAAEEPPQESSFRGLIDQYSDELSNQCNHALIDGRLASTLTGTMRELRREIGATHASVVILEQLGREGVINRERAAKESNSDKVANYTHAAKTYEAGFLRDRDLLVRRLDEEERLHRARPSLDLQFAADTKLMRRAIENVAVEGYAPYQEEPAAEVYKNLGRAFHIIEAKHEADMWLGEVRALMQAERQLRPTAIAKIQHPNWLERFGTGMEWPLATLQKAGIDWSMLEKLHQSRYGDSYRKINDRVSKRRWSGEQMVTAEAPLNDLQKEISEGLDALTPRVIEARETILKYVLTLSEQAREAAEKAREAQERTESRADSEQQTADTLDEQQEDVERAVRETMESLADLANTTDIREMEQRELARDADAALAQIQDALERGEETMQEAQDAVSEQERKEALDQNAEAMKELSERLEETAEHFEKAENGEDVSESREELRRAEEAMQIQEALQERADQAERMANAAESTPEELLEKLEQALKTNEPMQQELSEISERAAEAAQRNLERAAQKEHELNQSLERSDQAFQERKRRAAQQLRSLTQRAAAVDQALLNAVERAVGWANMPETAPKLAEAREQLREAVQESNAMGGENALLPEVRETAEKMSEAVKAATEAISNVNERTEKAQSVDLHKDKGARDRARDQLERAQRDARTQRSRAARSEEQQWAGFEREAGRRVSQAQSQKRNAENQKRQLEQRKKREKKNTESLDREIDKVQQRIDEADRSAETYNETREMADDKEKESAERRKSIDREKLKPLLEKNPAAELATRMTEQAERELSQIRKELNEVAEKTDFSDELRVPESKAQSLTNEQEQIQEDVSDAVEQLRRAARHEERLGQRELAEQLAETAASVAREAVRSAAEATESLRQASQDQGETPEASTQIAEAAEDIGAAAEKLAQLLAESEAGMPEEMTSESGNPDAAGEPEPGSPQAQGQQMAQTLDELDRAIAEQNQQTSQQGESDQQGESEGQQGEGQQGQNGQQQTAAEASQTLANAMNDQAQRAARQRQQQMNPASEGEGQEGDPNSESASSDSATQPGMPGEMPKGGSVETAGFNRLGDQWGQLREQVTEDASESKASSVPPQFRREIEAYFRAIARRSAEKSE